MIVSSLAAALALVLTADVGRSELLYDWRDSSSLYQDVDRTIPVATPGDFIGAVRDKSGHGRDLLQAISGRRAAYRTSGMSGSAPHAQMDGIDDHWIASGFVLPPAFTIFFVGTMAAGASRYIAAGTSASMTVDLLCIGTFRINGGVTLQAFTNDGLPHVHMVRYNKGLTSYWVDGVKIAEGFAGALSLFGLTLGADRTGASVMNGRIGYFEIVNGILSPSAEEAKRLELKAGFSIPT
ncbi:MAG: hypothetical protein ACO1SV_21445 [Fimbriimonas sp.]